MSEDKTKEMNGSKSFEERVFERFERIEGRLVNVEIKISKLEERQYDTKPIWEQVLAAIAEINSRLASMDGRFDAMDARFDAIDARFDRVDSRFDKLETDMDDGFRRVARKMEVLNDSFLEMQADQRYLDRRLEKIEAQENSS
jgi:acyl carrier protein phosphodiesterase